jgi:hypothetical protein
MNTEVMPTYATALIIAGVGTIVLRHDGSVAVVDRNRTRYEIDPAIVRAIVALAGKPAAIQPREETFDAT